MLLFKIFRKATLQNFEKNIVITHCQIFLSSMQYVKILTKSNVEMTLFISKMYFSFPIPYKNYQEKKTLIPTTELPTKYETLTRLDGIYTNGFLQFIPATKFFPFSISAISLIKPFKNQRKLSLNSVQSYLMSFNCFFDKGRIFFKKLL